MVLTRSKERVSNFGEVFTPDHIVKEMHELLPKREWARKDMIYLEPTCGNGQFLVQAIQKKIDSGLSPEAAANTTFGMDIMQDNIEESRLRVMRVFRDRTKGKYLLRIACMVVNNVFQVEDGLAYIRGDAFSDSQWEEKQFYDEDPTWNGMILPPCMRRGIESLAKELVRKVTKDE